MKKLFPALLAMVVMLSLFGCAPAAAPADDPASAPPAEAEKVTLHLWDTFTEEGQSAGRDKMIAKFRETHPNVEIVRDAQTIDDLRPVIQTALGADNGPDIFYYDTGPGYAGVLAKAGLLLPLDDAYAANKWNDRIFSWTKDRVTFDGKVYGIGNEVEFIGVYYNKKIFEELGVAEPKTYEEFIQICDKAKAAGYTPIAFADGPGWPAYHQFSILANNVAGKDKLDKVLFGDGSWEDPDFVKAVQLFFVDMNEAGYFLKDTTAISYEDGNAVFYAGDTAMHITGTWLLSEVTNNATDFEPGFFFFPSIEGKPVLPPGGLGSGYFVNAKSQHSAEAIAFLDFMFSADGAKIWLEDLSIIPPLAVNTADLNLTPLMKFAVDAVAKVPLGYNIDVLAGDQFNAAQSDGFQAVLLGMKTPDELIKELQAAWLADKAK
ncbi:MAG TPA: extracellular solute-binding protein [Anaerolineaceae bacterium]|nr:extracellular solute-binding protein [Anaerolineaceae bacterium]